MGNLDNLACNIKALFKRAIATNTVATAAPTKANLNAAYSAKYSGFIVIYEAITGGIREYQKKDGTATSDWIETIWSSGVKSYITT